MGFSPYTFEKALNDIRENSWVALNFDNPETAGAYATEITGSGYVRKKAVFGPIANNTMWVVEPITWQGLSQNRVTWVSGWNAEYNGDLQWSCPLAAPARILDGKGYSIAANSIVLSFA